MNIKYGRLKIKIISIYEYLFMYKILISFSIKKKKFKRIL